MIIAFGTYDKERHPRVAILIDGLRANGHEVTEINHPLGLSTAARVQMLKQPWRLPALALRLAARWWQLSADARRLRRSGADVDTVLVGYLGHFDVLLARLLFRRARIILDHLIFAGDTAKDRGAGGVKARLLEGLDRRAINAADIVLVDTVEHLAMLPDGTRGVVVHVGARDEWFAARRPVNEDAEGSAPTSVVFFGLYTPLQGAPSIAAGIDLALRRGAHLTATMIGTGQDWAAARRALGEHPSVRWLDWVDAAALPALVASHDISLGVFGTTPKAMRVVPNKVFESVAAGCAVVTSNTPPQRAVLGDMAKLVMPGSAEAIADALIELCSDRRTLLSAKNAARAGADEFRSERIVEPLLPILGERW